MFFVAVMLCLGGGLRYANSDARGCMAVAQSLLRTGSLTLSGPAADLFRNADGSLNYRVTEIDGRVEYYFPPGNVLLALPLVAIVTAAGHDADHNDRRLQRLMVGESLMATLFCLYAWCRRHFGSGASAGLALLCLGGTILGPTLAGAYWSLNSAIPLSGLAFLLAASPHPNRRRGGLIGGVLFCGYLCRPTFIATICGVFVLLLWRSRPAALAAAATLLPLLGGFMLFSHAHYGTWLPPYYLAARVGLHTDLRILYGLTLSPSRGLLVYAPVLVLLLPLAAQLWRVPPERRPLLAALGLSAGIEFLAVAGFPHWTGGHAYGPRLLSSCAFILLLALIEGHALLPGVTRQRLARAMTALLCVGLFINLPGIFVGATQRWNVSPNIDAYSDAVFDWRFPQFAVWTEAGLMRKCQAQLPQACQAAVTAAP